MGILINQLTTIISGSNSHNKCLGKVRIQLTEKGDYRLLYSRGNLYLHILVIIVLSLACNG